MNEASALTAKPCGDELPLFCTEGRFEILTPALRLCHLCITLAVRREQLRIAHMSGAWLERQCLKTLLPEGMNDCCAPGSRRLGDVRSTVLCGSNWDAQRLALPGSALPIAGWT
jgi:hypothetical protein